MNSQKIHTTILFSLALFFVVFASFYTASLIDEGTDTNGTFYYGITEACRNASCEIDLSNHDDRQCVNKTFQEEALRFYTDTCKPRRPNEACKVKTVEDFCNDPNSCLDVSIAHYIAIVVSYVMFVFSLLLATRSFSEWKIHDKEERTSLIYYIMLFFVATVFYSCLFFFHIQLSNVNAFGIDFVDCFEFYDYIYPHTMMYFYAITGTGIVCLGLFVAYFSCIILQSCVECCCESD